MFIGMLGDIVFSVSHNRIKTITNLKQSGAASFSEHKRHNSSSILEYTGRSPDDISFSVILSTELGVDVEKEVDKLSEYQQKGELLRLIIGKRVYGSYRWVITKYSVSYKYHDKHGRPTYADVSLSLKEYCK